MANHNQKRHLSQFFTPQAVVEFMYNLVGFDPLWKVMDPACGDGAFLKEALRRGASAVGGVDIDCEALEAARENLQEFEGRFQLFCQDGLAEVASDNGLWKGHYDLVVGNPPFASSKWRVRDREVLRHFTLAHTEEERKSQQLPLLGESIRPVKTRVSQVIEVLFLERFVQLARPEGKVAIILPEGVFANSNLLYVREWLVQNWTIEAVVGLPRDTFKDTGTTAKTAVLFLEKRRPPAGHKTVLAEVGHLCPNGQPNEEFHKVVAALGQPVAIPARLQVAAESGQGYEVPPQDQKAE
jgi:type I restriction enzyme M protein